MNYVLKGGDSSVVSNIRFDLKDAVKRFTDEQIAEQWREFSNSDEYLSKDRNAAFLKWLKDSYET